MESELAFSHTFVIKLAALLYLVDAWEIIFLMVLNLSLTLILGILSQTSCLSYLYTKTASSV